MAVTIKTKKGKDVTLLNPSEKGTKCADELRSGIRQTNDGHIKLDKFGNPIPLTDTEKAWRSGYLQAQKDSAKCYNAKKAKQSGNKK